MGSTWDTLAAGDQDAISGAHYRAISPVSGTSGLPKTVGGKVVSKPGSGLEPNYGDGLDSYGGGTYTSPRWSEVTGSWKSVGGSSHHCVGTYNPSAHDSSGLSAGQVAAVIAYNQC